MIRDVVGLNLALAVLSLSAFVSLSGTLVRTAGIAWLAYGVPHLIYHLGHLAPYSPVGRALNVVGQTAVLLGAVVLVRWRPEALQKVPSPASEQPGFVTSGP